MEDKKTSQTELLTLPPADSLRGKNGLLLFEWLPDENCRCFRKLNSQLRTDLLTDFTDELGKKWDKTDLEYVFVGSKDFQVKTSEKVYFGVPVMVQFSSPIDIYSKPHTSIIHHPTENFKIHTIFAKSSHAPSQFQAFKNVFGTFEVYESTEKG